MDIQLYRGKFGILDSFQIKLIACLCMTIDHMGALGYDIVGSRYSIFRMIGRIAAPLFLFILVQSIRHTENRTNFLKRLFVSGTIIGLSNIIFNVLGGDIFGICTFGNIIFTFFYTALYVTLIEKLISAVSQKNTGECAKVFFVFLISLLPCLVYGLIDVVATGLPVQQRLLISVARESLITPVDNVEYGIGFILLGLCLYFVKTKPLQGLVYFLFCIMCICGAEVARVYPDIQIGSSFASLYFDSNQCWMILALPIMMLYNQEKGRNVKGFFYWYYPLHRYVIIIVSSMLGFA